MLKNESRAYLWGCFVGMVSIAACFVAWNVGCADLLPSLNSAAIIAHQFDEDGGTGAAGEMGLSGINCWDLNGDGHDDDEEDVNGDGAWDAFDCQGGSGDRGPQGTQGDQGVRGEGGAEGVRGEPGAVGPGGSRGLPGAAGRDGVDGTAGEGCQGNCPDHHDDD